MIEITLGNSYSNIKGLTAKQQKDLTLLLSYTIGGSGAFLSGFGPRRRSLLGKRGDFPTGLLARIEAWLTKAKTPWSRVNPAPPKEFIIAKIPKDFPDAYQWQREALATAIIYPRGSIQAPTGTGKSRAMAMIAEGFGPRYKVLWIVPSLEIKKQTIESCKHLSNITITNIDDPKLKKMTDFDILLIDECHHSASKAYHRLNKTAWTKICRRYCFSATTFRNDPEEQLLYESIAGKVIYKLSYKDAVDKKYIVPIEAYYFETPKQPSNAYTYAQVYNELVVKNTTKNVQLAVLLKSMHSYGISTICLVKEIAHGKALQELTGFPFVNGQDEESRKYIKRFNEGALKVLIGTTGVLGEGVDSRPCEYVIIAGGGKAKSQFMQACGRAVRNYSGKETAKVVIIKDKSHKFLLRHFNQQKKILLDEFGVVPVKLEI